MASNVIANAKGKNWVAYNGDCIEVVNAMPRRSVHYSIFSPPFASLYTYSSSERDMGNCKTHALFFEQFTFLVKALKRVMMPGRLVSVHCMDIATSKQNDGFIGIIDFSGDVFVEKQAFPF